MRIGLNPAKFLSVLRSYCVHEDPPSVVVEFYYKFTTIQPAIRLRGRIEKTITAAP
jgi:hypothetical protein